MSDTIATTVLLNKAYSLTVRSPKENTGVITLVASVLEVTYEKAAELINKSKDKTPDQCLADKLVAEYGNRLIAAIKEYRTQTSCGLVEARDAIYRASGRTIPGY